MTDFELEDKLLNLRRLHLEIQSLCAKRDQMTNELNEEGIVWKFSVAGVTWRRSGDKPSQETNGSQK